MRARTNGITFVWASILAIGMLQLAGCSSSAQIDVESDLKIALGREYAHVQVAQGIFGTREATASIEAKVASGSVVSLAAFVDRLKSAGWVPCERPEFGKWVRFDDTSSGSLEEVMQYEVVLTRGEAVAEIVSRKRSSSDLQRTIIRVRQQNDRTSVCPT